MAFYRNPRRNDIDPFTDLLFNTLLIFTFLFLVAIVFLNPPTKTGDVELKAEYIVTVKWPDHNPDDIDIWIEDPNGRVVWFRNAEDGFMHLDRDDRGISNDTIQIDNQTVINPINQEVVTIRRAIPGEYVVNLHYYKSNSHQAVTAEVNVSRVNPRLEIVYYGKTRLHQVGEEKTVVRFSINKDRSVSSINTLQKSLVTVEAG